MYRITTISVCQLFKPRIEYISETLYYTSLRIKISYAKRKHAMFYSFGFESNLLYALYFQLNWCCFVLNDDDSFSFIYTNWYNFHEPPLSNVRNFFPLFIVRYLKTAARLKTTNIRQHENKSG